MGARAARTQGASVAALPRRLRTRQRGRTARPCGTTVLSPDPPRYQAGLGGRRCTEHDPAPARASSSSPVGAGEVAPPLLEVDLPRLADAHVAEPLIDRVRRRVREIGV